MSSAAAPADEVLRLEGVEVLFGQAPGLAPVSFTLARGERLAIVGPSGAGKTSLLRAIAGLAPASAGRILIHGRDVSSLPPEQRGAVYLHQTPLLFPHLDVGGNIAFPLKLRGVRGAELEGRVLEALDLVQLADLASRPVGALSGGQRHRVALARAIVARPALLLLDEPFAALDPALRSEVRAALLAVQARYAPGVVLVTHDLEEAALVGQRIGLLLAGSLAALAPPRDLFMHPGSLDVARFLGVPNFLPGTALPGDEFDCLLGRLRVPTGALRGPAVAVFWPDAATLTAANTGSATVVAIRQRAERVTASVEIGGTMLEIAVPPLDPPAVGSGAIVTLGPGRILLYPAPTPPAPALDPATA